MTAAVSAAIIVLLFIAGICLLVLVLRSGNKKSAGFSFSNAGETLSVDPRTQSGSKSEGDAPTRRRFFGFMIAIAAAIGTLLVKLWSMQIVSGAEYTARAEGNRISEYTTIAPRGRIYDRNGVELVGNRSTFAVLANADVQNDKLVIQRLSDVLGIPRETVKSLAASQTGGAQADRVIAERTSGGGCTMVMLYGQENGLQMAHIGDSRIYWFHEGQLRRLTRDHSKMEMLMEAGLITEEEARTHPQRHVITRALGLSGEAFCEATVGNPMPVADGDAYLLCSDGLTDMLPDREIKRIFREAKTADDCSGALYRGALEAGGKDNTTVLVLWIRADLEKHPL